MTRGTRELRELADSIAASGQMAPILVRLTPTGYEIVDGLRRAEAVEMLIEEGRHDQYVPALVGYLTEAEAEIAAVIGNTVREDLTYLDLANTVKYVRDRRVQRGDPADYETLRRLFQCSKGTIANRIAVATVLTDEELDRCGVTLDQLAVATEAELREASKASPGLRCALLQKLAGEHGGSNQGSPARSRTRNSAAYAFKRRRNGAVQILLNPGLMTLEEVDEAQQLLSQTAAQLQERRAALVGPSQTLGSAVARPPKQSAARVNV